MATFPELEGMPVLVTGGAHGIGQAIVRAFHQQRAQVFFCDTDASATRALQEELNGEVRGTRLDLQNEQQIKSWIGKLSPRCGNFGALINNAAIDPRIPLSKTSVRDWDRLFATNLRPYFLTSREAARFMSRGGSIVNLGSITFHNAPANMTAYVATKGGVLGFTRSLARELGPHRIRVNCVSPGWVMTERQLRDYVTPATKRMLRTAQSIPDLIQPSEIADVVVFLASQSSRAITGQEILVDRGWYHS